MEYVIPGVAPGVGPSLYIRKSFFSLKPNVLQDTTITHKLPPFPKR